jgi:hypothetical protein
MIVRLALWSLADTATTIDDLREYIGDESYDAFKDVPGLLFKAWIADESSERWGAIYVFASREAADQELPSKAKELIGKPPDLVEEFDVEGTLSVADELDRLGLAFAAE